MPSKTDPLASLNGTLRSLPAAAVREPDMPMAIFNQQGNDVVAFLEQNPAVRERLLKVGLPREVLDGLPFALGAAQAAESAWQAVFSPRSPADLVALEVSAGRLRADAVAALRWNLRNDRIAQGTLDAIQDGLGSADLVQDLDALAVLVEQHEGAFEADKTFDAKERARTCREKAKELRDALSGTRADMTRDDAKDLRDRAFTHADELVDQTREAARYAFRDEPETAARFQNRYLLRRVRRHRRAPARAASAAPPQPAEV